MYVQNTLYNCTFSYCIFLVIFPKSSVPSVDLLYRVDFLCNRHSIHWRCVRWCYLDCRLYEYVFHMGIFKILYIQGYLNQFCLKLFTFFPFALSHALSFSLSLSLCLSFALALSVSLSLTLCLSFSLSFFVSLSLHSWHLLWCPGQAGGTFSLS